MNSLIKTEIENYLETLGLVVKKFDSLNLMTISDNIPKKSSEFTIVLIKEGEASININDKDYNISKNKLCIISPNDYIINRTDTLNNKLSGYVIILSIDFVTNIYIKTEFIIPIILKIHEYPIIDLSKSETDLLCNYFDVLRIENYNNNSESLALICSGIITSLIYKLSDLFDSKVNNSNDIESKCNLRIFREFIKKVSTDYKKHRNVTYYASALCITPKYLSSIVKVTSKNTASKWIESFVIAEAKKLLRYSDMSIQEIAYSLNFPNPSFFGAYFKKYAGMAPGEYRKS